METKASSYRRPLEDANSPSTETAAADDVMLMLYQQLCLLSSVLLVVEKGLSRCGGSREKKIGHGSGRGDR